MSSLAWTAIAAMKWSAASQIGRQAIQFLTLVVLARLLNPHDFGLLGMAMVFVGLLTMVGDLGTASAVIQRKELTQRFLSTVFWANIFIGLGTTAALALCAPLIAKLYGQPALTPLLRVLSTAFLISSVAVLQQALLERRLALRRLALAELSSVVLASIMAIALAVVGFGVWSLVLQTLVYVTADAILLWILGGWVPALRWSWADAKGTMRFSFNLTGFNLVNYFDRNADNFLVGKYLGAQALGVYSLAYRVLLFPTQSVTWATSRVTFPVYSRIREQPERLREAYLRTASAIALFTFPLMMGVAVLSKPFTMVVFGSKWNGIAVVITILAPVGLIQSIVSTTGGIYVAKGRTDWLFLWGVGSTVVTVGGFVIGLHWGVVGVATSYAITSFALLYPCLAIPFRLIDLPFRNLLLALRGVFFASLAMLLSIVAAEIALPSGFPPADVLLVTVPLGVAVFAGAVLLLDRRTARDIIAALKTHEVSGPREVE